MFRQKTFLLRLRKGCKLFGALKALCIGKAHIPSRGFFLLMMFGLLLLLLPEMDRLNPSFTSVEREIVR